MNKTKVRSPNYPAISLGEAITKAKAIYDKEHKNPTNKEVIAKDLGYNGINGASLSAISALAKYGMLETTDPGQLKVSGAAESIFYLHPGEPERVELLKEMAFAPALFSELRDSFPEKLPSDQSLRYYLIKKDFNPRVVDSVIRAYRDTLEFLNAEETIASNSLDKEEGAVESLLQTQSSKGTHSEFPSNPNRITTTREVYPINPPTTHTPTSPELPLTGEILQCRISEDCTARVQFNGTATREGVKKLIAFLELNMDDYPTKESLKKPVAEVNPENTSYWQGELWYDDENNEEEG